MISKLSKEWWLSFFLTNTAIWAIAIAFLKLMPPSYTSEWAVMVLGQNAATTVSLPDVGKAEADSQARPSEFQDPRADYAYIMNSPAVLARAAEALDIELEDFGEPATTIDSDSALVIFEVEGDTPEQAQKKSELLYQFLSEELDRLRQSEIERRKLEAQSVLASVSKDLETAQKEISLYQSNANLRSEDQIQALASNIEALRQKQAETIADEQKLRRRLEQLSIDVDLGDQDVYSAYRLQTDTTYQQLFEELGQTSAELSSLQSQLGARHPQVIEKQSELNGVSAALELRGSNILGRTVTQENLVALGSISLDPQIQVIRGELFKELVTNQAELPATTAQIQALEQQIGQLDNRLQLLVQDKLNIDTIKVDLQLAEAIFTATLAELNFGQEDIYSIYPPIQLIAAPTLPNEDEPTFPEPKIVILAAVAASFIVTAGLLILWWEQQNPWFKPKIVMQKEHG